MRNPRSCVCGHLRSDHSLPLSSTVVSGFCRPCWRTFMALDTGGTLCRIYRLGGSRAGTAASAATPRRALSAEETEGEAMSNPRPCACGHPASKHGSGLPAFGNRCIACYFGPGDWSGCLYYRPAPRKEPLRVRRGRNERVHVEVVRPWIKGGDRRIPSFAVEVLRKAPDNPTWCEAELTLDDGRVLTVEAQWKNGVWDVEMPAETAGRDVTVRFKARATT